jgi:hypothetical protein
MCKSRLFFDETKFLIEKIEYQSIELDEEDTPEQRVSVHDEYFIRTCEDDRLVIEIQRRIAFEPPGVFELSVVALLDNHIDKERSDKFANAEEIRDYVLDHIYDVISNSGIMAEVSLIIANITSSFGRIPLILPPDLILDETTGQD